MTVDTCCKARPARLTVCGNRILGVIGSAALGVSATTVLATAADLAAPAAAPSDLGDIIVTATLRPLPALDVAGSVTVLDAMALRGAGRQHFEETLALVPNLNWAGDTSRPRYFQLRGIGELEQYQGAPNPSIGFLIDDVDFSGLGSAATLFDVDRIEVLRGPQSTRYGANALGGLIYVASAAPESEFGGRVEVGGGDYNARSLGAVLTGPVEPLDSAFRLALQRHTSDGYYHNAFLGRYDTNRMDESTLRGRWRYRPSESLQVDLTALHVQLDNGYDAFSPDNTRTTHSDQPSVDSQHSSGAAARVVYSGLGAASVTGLATYGETRSKYGFDGDWGNPGYWAPYVNSFAELQARLRRTASAELRISTAPASGMAWLAGAYVQQLDEALDDASTGRSNDPINGPYSLDTVTDSGYRVRSYAVFGVLDGDAGAHLRWSVGLRGERRTSRYQDLTHDRIGGLDSRNEFRPTDQLWGGHASLTYRLAPAASLYLQVARGYKAGGFNLSQGLQADELSFRPEADWNLEAGYKADLLQRRLNLSADVFYLYRRDAQIKSSLQSDPNNPNSFVYYTGNAVDGFNYGLEASADWHATGRLSVGGTIGLLNTSFNNLRRIGDTGTTRVSRELANAPNWQLAVNATYRAAGGVIARLDASGMGGYYFDLPPNPTRSHPYGLVNGKLGWESGRVSVYAWGRNLLNKNYPVRGFFFGLEPPNYPNKLYLQLGAPRTFGLDAVIHFGAGGH